MARCEVCGGWCENDEDSCVRCRSGRIRGALNLQPTKEVVVPPAPTIGAVVIYRSRTGDYDVPAIVNCTVDTLNAKGVELGHVPPLDDPWNVHLTVFTPGKPGMRRDATDFKVESEHGRGENVAGCYQEWDIPYSLAAPDEDPAPGTWRWLGPVY